MFKESRDKLQLVRTARVDGSTESVDLSQRTRRNRPIKSKAILRFDSLPGGPLQPHELSNLSVLESLERLKESSSSIGELARLLVRRVRSHGALRRLCLGELLALDKILKGPALTLEEWRSTRLSETLIAMETKARDFYRKNRDERVRECLFIFRTLIGASRLGIQGHIQRLERHSESLLLLRMQSYGG